MHPPPREPVSVGVTSMTNNNLPTHDVAFLTALADFLLASGSDRAADVILSSIETESGPICHATTQEMCVCDSTPLPKLSAEY